MRRFILAGTLLVLVLFGAQAALAQYGSNGSLTVDPSSVAAGATTHVTGTGFGPGTQVHITIQSASVLLATVNADGAGTIDTTVTIPNGFSGQHEIVATGVDAGDSVWVLDASIQVGNASPPNTSTLPGAGAVRSSDASVLALAGALIVIFSVALYAVARRARL